MTNLRLVLAIIASLLTCSDAFAFDIAKEFSAEAVQTIPGRPPYYAKMYVSKDAVRTDSKMNNVNVVEILYPAKLTQVLLVPSDKIYLEKHNSNPPPAMAAMNSDSDIPCAGMQDTTCRSLGKEDINGRQTEKWEFTTNQNGHRLRSLYWIDVERHMPIREFYPDGTVVELQMQGTQSINGRNTEKWIMRINRADGQSMESTQWYDPELKMNIREELPGGYLRELRDIKIGTQSESLYVIPKGYRKVEKLPAELEPKQPQLSSPMRQHE